MSRSSSCPLATHVKNISLLYLRVKWKRTTNDAAEVSAGRLVGLPIERRKDPLAIGLNDRRVAGVLTKGLVRARDDVRVSVYLAGSTDHSHQSPQRAECCRI